MRGEAIDHTGKLAGKIVRANGECNILIRGGFTGACKHVTLLVLLSGAGTRGRHWI